MVHGCNVSTPVVHGCNVRQPKRGRGGKKERRKKESVKAKVGHRTIIDRMNETYRNKAASLSPLGVFRPVVDVVHQNKNRKSVTKKYKDGRSLSMLVVNDEILEKHMTYKMQWDLVEMRKVFEKGEGAVSFKYWEKRGLSVLKSFYGTHLVGLMMTLDYTRVTHPKVKCETVEDELEYDIDFPMVDVRKLPMLDGYSSSQSDNVLLGSIMHRRIVGALLKFEEDNNKKSQDGAEFVDRKRKAEEDVIQCDVCGDSPCVWRAERDTIIARDEIEHGHQTCTTVANSTRRKTAYRHMFIVINGGYGQKGVRKRLPECIENGVRALFPDPLSTWD